MPAVDWAKQSVMANQLHGRTAGRAVPKSLVELGLVVAVVVIIVVAEVAGKRRRRRWPLGLIKPAQLAQTLILQFGITRLLSLVVPLVVP